MSIADKLITIANNTPSVCEKLKSSKTSVSGSAIAVNDVNATEHGVDINLTSDTITDFSGVTVSRYGKNLLKTETKSGTTSGITHTVNDNGEITLTGTAGTGGSTIFVFGNSNNRLNLVAKEDMVLSGSPVGASDSSYRIMTLVEKVGGGNTYPKDFGNGVVIEKGQKIIYIYINVAKDYKITEPIVFKPQLEVGTEWVLQNNKKVYVKTDFEPYKEPQNITAVADGTVKGITSASPNMTLISTNENVVINADYISKNSNADTEKITELNEAFANAKAILQELRV